MTPEEHGFRLTNQEKSRILNAEKKICHTNLEVIMNCNKLREAARPRLPALVLAICLAQPGLDVISFWLDRLGMSNALTLVLRFGMLFAVVGSGFLLSDRKRYYFLLAGILGAFTLCHMAVCWKNGYVDIVNDLVNLVRIYQLPLVTLSMITYLRQNPEGVAAIRKGFTIDLLFVFVVEVLSVLTATNPYTYPNKSLGVLGWFCVYFPNAQSSILSMLVPVFLADVMERKKMHPVWTLGAGLIAFGILYFFATRLAFAALLGTTFALAVSLLVIKWKDGVPAGRAAAVMALCGVLAVALVTVSPMYVNRQMMAVNAGLKQEHIHTLVAADEAAAEEAGLEGQERKVAVLKGAYEEYLAGMTGRFGLERTAEIYNYSTDVSVIADMRLQKNTYNQTLLKDKPSARLFGLQLADTFTDGVCYDSENDFHGIYFLTGMVGLGLMLAFLGFFALRIAVVLVKDFKTYFTLENAGYGIALICAVAHGYFTAGGLRRANTTFYLAIVLAAIYMQTRKKMDSSVLPEG